MVSMGAVRSTAAEERVAMTNVPLDSPPPTSDEVRQTIFVSLAVCGFYISVSSSMVFVNKALTYTFQFRSLNALLFMQMVFTILVLRLFRHQIGLPNLEMRRMRQIAPVSLFYCLNALAALSALSRLSVPSYTMVKRLAPLFTLALEFFLLRRRPGSLVVVALAVMATGTVLAARADSRSSTYAWILGFGSCVFQAAYLTCVKRSGIETGLSSINIVFYHAHLSLPFFALITLVSGEVQAVLAFEHWLNPAFIIVLVLSLGMGLLLNYALFLCTEKTSPTSTVVSGQVKAMGQTTIGLFTFGGVDLNTRYIFGTLVNISGGILYAYAKFKALQMR